jgi:serine-type D-Ala-D-Ala carboxypeptidase (penicillin-binding protein 5/6)
MLQWSEGILSKKGENALNRHHLLLLPKAFVSKRFVAVVVLINLLFMFVLSSLASAADSLPIGAPQLDAKSAILMDAETGQVLYQLNADVPAPPASMSKMMTEYLVSKAVKQGKLSWDETVKVGENASQQIGSRIFLAQGDQHTIKELYIAMAVGSANDATTQLAETVAGSEEAFVKLMNSTAVELGMTTAHFINSTGLDRTDMPAKYRPSTQGETVMSARDSAILAYHILKDEPEFLDTSKIQKYKFRPRDKKAIDNWNWMLGSNKDNPNLRKFAYEGVDGMKTGHTSNAGNCFTGTALRNGTRLIAVVMGVPGGVNDGKRFLETAKLFDYGFNNFEKKTIIQAKATVPGYETLMVKNGVSTKLPVVTASDITVLIPKGQPVAAVVQEVKSTTDPLVAPIKLGDKVGKVTYKYKDPSTQQDKSITIDLIAAQGVDKASWWRLLLRAIGDFFSGLFKGITGRH